MEHLRKQYTYFFGEIIHQEKIFQNYLFHFLNLSQQYLFPEYYTTMKTNRIKVSVGFFLRSNPLKINISNEEERFNFNY
jgi:hypothetical protein